MTTSQELPAARSIDWVRGCVDGYTSKDVQPMEVYCSDAMRAAGYEWAIKFADDCGYTGMRLLQSTQKDGEPAAWYVVIDGAELPEDSEQLLEIAIDHVITEDGGEFGVPIYGWDACIGKRDTHSTHMCVDKQEADIIAKVCGLRFEDEPEQPKQTQQQQHWEALVTKAHAALHAYVKSTEAEEWSAEAEAAQDEAITAMRAAGYEVEEDEELMRYCLKATDEECAEATSAHFWKWCMAKRKEEK